VGSIFQNNFFCTDAPRASRKHESDVARVSKYGVNHRDACDASLLKF